MDSFHDGHVLARYCWSDAVAERFERLNLPGTVPGRVVRSDRGGAVVATGHGDAENHRWSGTAPVTGDWVAVAGDSIVAIAERSTAITRGNAADTGDQVLAANVDRALVIIALDTKLSLNRLERALALVWGGGATPVIVMSKADLVDSSLLNHQRRRVDSVAIGAEVVVASSLDGRGMDHLHELAGHGCSVVLLGASGVGKSTIGNLLIGSETLDVGRTRGGDSKGRHTTVRRELFPTTGGGVLIDTPGLRGLGLASSAAGISMAFDDIESMAVGCRFRDCTHVSEPGCAVVDNVAPRRLDSYRKLNREQVAIERRAVVRERRQARRSRSKYDRRRGW